MGCWTFENNDLLRKRAKSANMLDVGTPMTINEQQSQAFKEFERTGWAKQAEHYDSLVGEMTRQAVAALLAAANARSGSR